MILRLLSCVLVLSLLSCERQGQALRILGNVEDPQNEIAEAIADIVNSNSDLRLRVKEGIGSLANLDSLEAGRAEFGIVDNFSRLSDDVQSIMPLYPQVLHVLHKKTLSPKKFYDLFFLGKIYAGTEGSGTRLFISRLMEDMGIDETEVEFIDAFNLFEADVIFSFTDLLRFEELKDLEAFTFFSLDDVQQLGRGSLAEGICARYPQFKPYVISNALYGSFTETPVLTVKVDALLVCRADVDPDVVYEIMETLRVHAKDIKSINPLLYSMSFNPNEESLNFTLHEGARNYIDRYEPTFFEKYADVFSVIISVFVTLASSVYTISKWQSARKKDKIDVYYQKVLNIRSQLRAAEKPEDFERLHEALKDVQEETVHLVVEEKLMANESFSIFLNLSRIIDDEIQRAMRQPEVV